MVANPQARNEVMLWQAVSPMVERAIASVRLIQPPNDLDRAALFQLARLQRDIRARAVRPRQALAQLETIHALLEQSQARTLNNPEDLST